MRLDEETKQRLKDAGVWKPFCDMRMSLKLAGTSPAEAAKLALKEFLPTGLTGSDDHFGVAPPCDEGGVPRTESKSDGPPAEAQEVDLDPANFVAPGSFLARIPKPPPEVLLRTATEVENIRWVSNHLAPGTKLDDCPSPYAWVELMVCRCSLSYLENTFLPKRALKLVPTKADEAPSNAPMDGAAACDVLEKIQTILDTVNGIVMKVEDVKKEPVQELHEAAG